MEMRFFWIGDKIAQQMYDIKSHPGQENLADYQSKHHIGLHHTAVRPWYLHLENSPRILPRAKWPSALKGCVGTPAMTGTHVKYPYRELHGSSMLVRAPLRLPKMYQYILGPK
jgi:hypothetical protein